MNEIPHHLICDFLYWFWFDFRSYFFHETFDYSIFVNLPNFAIKSWYMHLCCFEYFGPRLYSIPRWHTMYRMPLLLSVVSGSTNSSHTFWLNTLPTVWIITTCFDKAWDYGSVAFLQTLPVCSVLITCPFGMALVVRVELNDIQTLLSYDNAREYLERNGWLA